MRQAAILLMCVLLTAVAAGQSGAQPAIEWRNAVRQTNVKGTLERSKSGLALRTAYGKVEVHLGRLQRSPLVRRAVETGAGVQLSGKTVRHKGRVVFLADEVTLYGRTIRVRNANGIVLPGRNLGVQR